MTTLISRYAIHQPGAPALEVSGLTVRYNSVYALDNISFQLKRGERVAVVGPNGAGKSTLFQVIAGVLSPTRGEVKVYGHKPGGHICIAYVPQRSQVDWTFPVNVADVVMMGRIGRLGLFRWPQRHDWNYVHQCLEIVSMADLAERQIGELSGGQQQRVFIARALAQEAELMLMDEPLTGLDAPSQEGIFEVLEELRQREVTVMLATHDLNLAAERFDRLMLLNHRLVGIGQPDQVFTRERLAEAYGGQMRLIETEEGLVVLNDTCCGGGHHSHE
ncbi:MAG: metal ABC transporter ATP-binding protein [Anaerolineae bacterium]